MSYEKSICHFSELISQSDPQVTPYINNYVLGHTAALANTFLLTYDLLKQKVFTALGTVYSQYYPPSCWDLNLYGDSFPLFLESQKKGPKAQEYQWDFIADVAAIEYAITQQYYAQDNDNEKSTLLIREASKLSQKLFETLKTHHPYIDITTDAIHAESITIFRHELRIIIDKA